MSPPGPTPPGAELPDAGTLRVDVLGSGTGHPTALRDTTSLLVGGGDGWSLIDCPGSVVHKLARLGLSPSSLRRVILTHNHVDHVYGLPHLLHALAIAAETEALELAAPAQTLATVRDLVTAHGLEGERYPRLELVELALEEDIELDAGGGARIRFAPAEHGRDTVSVRFDAGEGAALCHSSDTRPCDALVRLARGADMLFHDCGGPHRLRERFAANHSSAREAGQTAEAAGVDLLVLLHLGVDRSELVEECVAEARGAFGGQVVAASDGARWRLPLQG